MPMSGTQPLDQRVLAVLDATPRRIPFVVGGCGSGRTTLLRRLQQQRGARQCQYVDVERSATTPERFYRGLVSTSPFRLADSRSIRTPRDAFSAILDYLTRARTEAGTPALVLLDGALEFRTFESFPGLRGTLRELIDALAASDNLFVLATRYTHRAERLLRDAPQYAIARMPPLGESEIRVELARSNGAFPGMPATAATGETVHVVQALSDGRAAYVEDICREIADLAQDGGADPISALTALLAPGGRLSARCRFSYELRLHRARGYGALKAILDILAQESALTLTEIAQRLHRTPGSTKDYLSWLEDVDLVTTTRKRYAFADPVLRLWVRLHCRPVPPHDEEVAREVQRYAIERLAQAAPVVAEVV